MNSGGTEHKPTKRQWFTASIVIPVVAAIGAAAIGAGALVYVNRDKDDSASTAESPTSAEPVVPPVSPPTTTTSATPRPAAQVYLEDLDPIEGNPRNGSADINGETYPHSVYTNFGGCRKSGKYVYDIGRDWTTLDTTIGLRDDTESASVVQVEIFDRDTPIYNSGNLSVGQSIPVSIPIDDVLQLKIGFVYIDGEMGMCSDDGYVVWGDPTLR
ncbi:putative uncharacterized protein [Rhodococcus sp. AW25M09]|uniref:NPCBM/NEW2 domain-containing protein n=1 Tax=Rhodococcus sp. AW25M09 TaxID=1268303 RepID=UPI0002AC8944|nr:NPCBM/NEW2 domain-containing protein [Rhodococcus sp. AW25M09]CCQ18429.1 putative uncharacterized protein [Rhodococcus sp. AW25M09]